MILNMNVMKRTILILFCAGILLNGCKSAKPYEKPEESVEVQLDKKNQTTLSLAQRISKLPGMTLRAGVPVFTRVANDRSIAPANKQPLYVLNGYPLGRSFRQIQATVQSAEVKDIKALIGPEAATYGLRGASGVIEVTTF